MPTKFSLPFYAPILACVIAIIAYGGVGCTTTDPDRLERQLQRWVPEGTSLEEASRTMTKHGFGCKIERNSSANPSSTPALVCRKHNAFLNRDWLVIFTSKDGKVLKNEYYISTDFFRIAPSNP